MPSSTNVSIVSSLPSLLYFQVFSTDLYLRHMWFDERLAFNLSNINEFSLNWLFLDKVWTVIGNLLPCLIAWFNPNLCILNDLPKAWHVYHQRRLWDQTPHDHRSKQVFEAKEWRAHDLLHAVAGSKIISIFSTTSHIHFLQKGIRIGSFLRLTIRASCRMHLRWIYSKISFCLIPKLELYLKSSQFYRCLLESSHWISNAVCSYLVVMGTV